MIDIDRQKQKYVRHDHAYEHDGPDGNRGLSRSVVRGHRTGLELVSTSSSVFAALAALAALAVGAAGAAAGAAATTIVATAGRAVAATAVTVISAAAAATTPTSAATSTSWTSWVNGQIHVDLVVVFGYALWL